MAAHIPLLLIPWLSPPAVRFFCPRKAQPLSHWASPPLSLPLLLVCVSLPHSVATMSLSDLPHPVLAPSSRQGRGALPALPERPGISSHPSLHPRPLPPATCLAGPSPSLGSRVWQGLQGSVWMAEPVRLTEAGPPHQAAGGQPPTGHASSACQQALTTSRVLFGRNLPRVPTPPSRMKTPKVGGGLAFNIWAPRGLPAGPLP